jgi:hypothetical protein
LDEVPYVTGLVRRLALLVALQPQPDVGYVAARDTVWKAGQRRWPVGESGIVSSFKQRRMLAASSYELRAVSRFLKALHIIKPYNAIPVRGPRCRPRAGIP